MTKRYWWVIVTYIITLFAAIIYAPIIYAVLPVDEFQASIYGTLLSFIIGLIVIIILIRPSMKIEANQNTLGFGKIIGWSILGVVMAYLAQAIAVTIEINVFNIKPGSENTSMIMDISRSAPLFIIIPALIAPILEEIVFRKVIFGFLYKRTNFFIAAILSALVFGIIHGEPMHILIYASMGMVFAFVYVKTKRIIVPILVHMLLNTLTIIAQFSLTPEDIERMQRELEQLQTFIGGALF